MHAFHGTQLLHCKSIVDQLGAVRWAEFEAGLATLQASVHGEAEALLRQACGDAAATLDARGTFLERRQCTVDICIPNPNPDPNPSPDPNPNPNPTPHPHPRSSWASTGSTTSKASRTS